MAVCPLAALRVQFSINTCDEWLQNALWYHQLMSSPYLTVALWRAVFRLGPTHAINYLPIHETTKYSQVSLSYAMQQCLHTCATGALVLSLRFNGHFPGGPGLASTRMSPFWILLELELKVMVTTRAIRRVKLQSKCHHHQQINAQFFTGWMPFRHLTNCVKALKGAVVPSK